MKRGNMARSISPSNPREVNILDLARQTKDYLMRALVALVFATLTCACANSGPAGEVGASAAPRTAWIVALDGRAIGQAQFVEGPAGVLIRLEFVANALPPGWHGMHLHERGDCSDFATGFQTSGPHVAHNGARTHGLLHPEGPESGDLPNLFAAPQGPFGAEVFTPRVSLAELRQGGRMPLLDEDGAALIIHAGPDDHRTQPIGGAGARIACAALTQLP